MSRGFKRPRTWTIREGSRRSQGMEPCLERPATRAVGQAAWTAFITALPTNPEAPVTRMIFAFTRKTNRASVAKNHLLPLEWRFRRPGRQMLYKAVLYSLRFRRM